MNPVRNLYICVAILLGLLLVGTCGYVAIERWPLLDAFYMTVITVSTVGFKEVLVMSPAGRLFTIFLIIVGVGFIALSGVSVEIGVVMLVYLNQALEKHLMSANKDGRPMTIEEVRSAVIDGALLRVRPIMMTVAAIIAGLLPIMFGDGTGSEVMRRIAAPMVGGMVSATLLTLVVIPAVFLLWKSKGLKQS